MATLIHLSLVLLLVTTFLEETNGFFGGDKVRLRDISTLTLYSGKTTTGRRSSSVKQIQCVGGSAGCTTFTPQVIQCYNRGFDGYDVQWECKTDMDNSYRFGQIDVTCEGYDNPNDDYVLKGSCGVEYTLDLTKEGTQNSQNKQHSYYGNNNQGSGGYGGYGSYKHSSGGIGDWIMLAVVGVIIYGIYRTCIATSTNNSDYPDDGHHDGNNRWSQGRGNGGNPPGSGPGYPPDSCSGTRGNTTTGTGSMGGGAGGGGFWSGAAAGGLLGYMFGNRGGGYGGYGGYGRPRYGYGGRGYGGRSFGSGLGGSGFGGSGFGGGGGGFSTGTRTASGFGGTRRR